MARIDELQKKYPTIPRDVIVKWEVLSRGVRDTEDLDKVSDWKPASGSYQNKFDDVPLKEIVGKPSRLKDGRMLRPGTLYMKSGEGAGLHIGAKSPYEIREVGEGNFALYEGEEKVEVDIYFPRPKPREGAEPLTSKGTPISRLIRAPRNCVSMIPMRYCEYFSTGEQCRFCNFNPSQDEARSIGLDRPVTENLEEMVEAYKIRGSEARLVEAKWELGGFPSSEVEDRIHANIAERLASALPYKPNFKISTQATTRKGMQRLKDAGLNCMCIQMEMWEPHLFAEVVPGKANHAPFEAWLESVSDAVDVFGVGSVAHKTIGGLSLIPPNGHKTWQEARDSHVEAVRWAVKVGALPAVGYLGLPPGTVYGADKSNLEKLPPSEYYLDIFLAHHETMMERGLYDKVNKIMYCGLCCSAELYVGELGVLALAGDWGNWMADVVPEKANWILQFIRSVAQTAPATSAGAQ